MLRTLIASTILTLILVGCGGGVTQEDLDAAISRLEAKDEIADRKLVDLNLTIDSNNTEVLADVARAMAAGENNMQEALRTERAFFVNAMNETVAQVNDTNVYVEGIVEEIKKSNAQELEGFTVSIVELLQDNEATLLKLVDDNKEYVDKNIEANEIIVQKIIDDALGDTTVTLEVNQCKTDKALHWLSLVLHNVSDNNISEAKSYLSGGMTDEQYVGMNTARCEVRDGHLRLKPAHKLKAQR